MKPYLYSKLSAVCCLRKLTLMVLMIVGGIQVHAQESQLVIEGLIKDNYEMAVPYVAVTIPSKNIGTTSTEEGTFYLSLQQSNLQDTIVVSSMGFKSFKIKVEDYIKNEDRTIVLEDDVNELEAVEIKDSKEYVLESIKNADETFIDDTHQLNMIYRRTDVQHEVSKFFVEHYMSMQMKGPKSEIRKMQVHEVRKSADYRIVKRNQWDHAAVYMININPLRDFYASLKKMDWKKTGDTTYDGEDVVILEGTKEKVKNVGKLVTTVYIGFDTNNVYKIECSAGNAVYQYAKNADGKMYLSYHRREYPGRETISARHQQALGLDKPQITSAYRHEAFVLSVITDKKKMTTKGYDASNKEMADIKLPYNEEFWKNLSLPPETAFYKKIKAELESNYGVPLETQFKFVN